MNEDSVRGVGSTVIRRALVPISILAGLYSAGPWILRRAFAPPQRDATQRPADLGLPEQNIWLSSRAGPRLHGWYIPVEGQAPAVIVLHGWGGNSSLMLPLASHLHGAGFHTLFLDARNHGLSEHDRFTSMPRFAEDLEVGVRWLHDRPEVAEVGAIGHSVGAGAAILSASQSDALDAVVAVAAPAHPGEMMREQMRSIPEPFLTLLLVAVQRIIGSRFDSFAPRNRIGLVKVPVMLVHGSADRVVPVDNVYELASQQPDAALVVVPDAGHSDLQAFEDHVGDIIGFLDHSLRGVRTT